MSRSPGWRNALLLVPALSLSILAAPVQADSVCSDPLAAEDQAAAALHLNPAERNAINQFYRSRGTSCAWNDSAISALESVLNVAADQGLDPDRYDLGSIATQPTAVRDLFATAMALRYAHDMVMGEVDLADLSDVVDVPRPAVDLAGQLAQAISQNRIGDWLASLAPPDPQYARLVKALALYRGKIARDDWKPTPEGPTLRQGQSGPRVVRLKERLAAEGDLRVASFGPNFGAATKAAVASFQRRHGIAPDGRFGRVTLAALNVTDKERLEQILANLARRRFYGHVLPPTRIEVNIAAATATLYQDWHEVLTMRAVVGDRRHHSPLLISPRVDSIVLNPPWVVPVSIIDHEILPKLAREPDYLEQNDMHWRDGQLVQSPGPKNSLGRIKFDFPNPFSVFMHDTPARSLFARDDRARSHGCVRLEKPLDLALTLLKNNPDWPRERIEATIAGGDTVRIDVADGPPVVFAYWTAFVDDDGTLEFRDDLYDRDRQLLAALPSVGALQPAENLSLR